MEKETASKKQKGGQARASPKGLPQVEAVVRIPLDRLHPFPDHPFKVRDDAAMQETIESVKTYGVLTPAIVRPIEDGYEIIAGHRRCRASELAGLPDMPAIVRDMDDDTATIFMVDSNLQREDILPSERAKAYKMKLEAIKRKAGRPSRDSKNNSPQVAANFRADDVVAKDAGISGDTVRRYIRLTELKPELQEMVDTGKMAMTPAVELSYLKPKEQELLLETIGSEQATPSLSQAQRIRKLSQLGGLNEDTMLSIMSEQKKPDLSSNIVLSGEKLSKYFPRSYTPAQIENTIFKLLDSWLLKRQRDKSR